MSIFKRAITPPKAKPLQLKNVSIVADANGPVYMSRDRTAHYFVSAANLYRSVDAGATQSLLHTFPSNINGMVQTADGECLVSCIGTHGTLYKSSGFGANGSGLTAITWTLVLTSHGDNFAAWSLKDDSVGTDGIIVIGEYGAQTSAGNTPTAATSTAAVYTYISYNNGTTWLDLFNLLTLGTILNPAFSATSSYGVHMHDIAYDQDNNRIWATFGDNTGGGKVIANGFMEILYSDNLSSITDPTQAVWNLMPVPTEFSDSGYASNGSNSAIPQFVCMAITKSAIVFGCDAFQNDTASFSLTKKGYRTFGRWVAGPQWVGGNNYVNKFYRAFSKSIDYPLSMVVYNNNGYASAVQCTYLSPDGGLSFQQGFIEPDQVTYTASVNSSPSAIFGPDIQGRVVSYIKRVATSGGAITYNRVNADLTGPVDLSRMVGSTATIVDGGTIPHGLGVVPTRRDAKQTVANRQVFVTAADATNLTVALKDLTGIAITTAEPVYWTAGA